MNMNQDLKQSSAYQAPEAVNSVTETLRNSAAIDPLPDLNSYRSSIDYGQSRM